MARQAHLIGSVSLPTAEMVMTTAADFLDDCCTRIPDGETGERGYWIRWQKTIFESCSDLELEMVTETVPGFQDTVERPFFKIKEGTDLDTIDLGELGYADAAIASYAIFKKLQGQGIIGQNVRFQVSIPSPMALIVGFITPGSQLGVEPAIIAAMKRDLAKLQAAIPSEDLAVQFDVCYEVVAVDAGTPLPYHDKIGGSVTRVAEMCDYVSDAVELGIHLCYGDPGHKHIVEPKDLATSVSFANGISKSTKREINFMHMPVPVNRKDEDYFIPLRNLKMDSITRLILGLVHHSDGLEGSKARVAVAETIIKEFDIATECGFGRRASETIPELLQIHRDLCD